MDKRTDDSADCAGYAAAPRLRLSTARGFRRVSVPAKPRARRAGAGALRPATVDRRTGGHCRRVQYRGRQAARRHSRSWTSEPIVDPVTFDLLRWAAEYYHHPLGEVFAAALPVSLRAGQPALRQTEWWSVSEAGRRELTPRARRGPRSSARCWHGSPSADAPPPMTSRRASGPHSCVRWQRAVG